MAGRSDESAGSPGPDSAVATALPVVGDGWARLHLRRDGRGHRRVPPSVGEDRVGAERGPVFTLVAAAAPNYPVFVGARVLAGLGTGAESAIIAPFLAEFVPPARRGWFLGALAGFFSFGFVGAALIGRFVVPLSDSGWRWAPVVTAVPVLMVLWWHRSLPESPRYLLLRGRTAEAELVVADFERRAEASPGTALPPSRSRRRPRSRSGRRLRRALRAHGISSAFRAPRQHHGTGDHRVLRGRARVRRRVHDDHGRPPGRGRGRAGVRSVGGRPVTGGAERAAGAGRGRVARRAVMLAGTTS